ncbi:MAG TPA: GGDEF domain-containing protein [Vicinamibacteria bacterium]|nr:GGDEF domain-containing protein [Vicinamibacteria bacterium]
MRQRPGPRASLLLAGSAVLVAVVAGVDYVTGAELRVFPLYFLPILAVSLRLGWKPGVATAAVCAAAWRVSNELAGMKGSRSAIDVANLVVMAVAFGAIALLGARQRGSLLRERAISRTDGLTGLLNGRGFYEAAAVELARSTRYRHSLTLAYVDLDDFKGINDRLGHARGDSVLVAVARALRRGCRSTDLVGRLGGDEFVVLFPETGRDAAEAALVKLRSRLEEAASGDGTPVTASVGSVSYAEPPADVESLVREADATMYAAKASGKNALRCVAYGENQ